MEPFPHQVQPIQKALEYLRDPSRKKPEIIVAPTACHAKGYKVLTYKGDLKKVEDIIVGDQLMGVDSTPRGVLELHSGIDLMYEITLRNGITFTVNQNHILHLHRTNKISKKPYQDITYPLEVNIPVKDYINWAISRKHLYKLNRLGVTFPVNLDQCLLIDPYYLGLWLGDGTATTHHITTMDEEVKIFLKKFAEQEQLDYKEFSKQGTKAVTVKLNKRVGGVHSSKKNHLQERLRGYGLTEEKHIPTDYLTASEDIRLTLLAGIIDTDGYRDFGSNYEFTSKDERLVNDVYFLCNSLGYCATLKKVKKACTNCVNNSLRDYFRLTFRADERLPCTVERRKPVLREYHKANNVYSFTVKEVGEGEFYGFTLSGDHLYLDEHFILQHNSGKSFLIAAIAHAWPAPTLVLQPSQELLEQNIDKLFKVGGQATIYSASLNTKELSHLTYATLGSIKKDVERLIAMGVKTVIVDECHSKISPEPGSEFSKFMEELKPTKVIGLTATPFRLKNNMEGSELKLLTRMRPNYFKGWIDIVQIQDIIRLGYWSKIKYETYKFDEAGLAVNTSGSDFTEDSMRMAIKAQGVNNNIYLRVKQLLNDGCPSILIVLDSVENAEKMAEVISNRMFNGLGGAACLHGKTSKKDRKRIVADFKSGKLSVITNVGVLVTGFDYPDLRCVIMGRPTMSLALYYQIIGRGTRIFPGKVSCLYIDYCNNVERFGMIENLTLEEVPGWGWGLFNNDILLTNTLIGGMRITKQDIIRKVSGKVVIGEKIWFGAHTGTPFRDLPLSYIDWCLNKSGWEFSNGKMRGLKEKMLAVVQEHESKKFKMPQ